MQGGVREEDVKFTEVEQTLMSGLVSLESLVMGIGSDVSLNWYNIVVTNYTSALVQGMWLWHVVAVSPGVFVCVPM